MAEIWGAAIIAGGAIIGGAMSADAAGDAADQANKGAQAGISEEKRQFNTFQNNIAPYLDSGNGALTGLKQLMAGDYSGFESSPDYAYTRDQAQQGIERGAAARGSLYSGGTNVDLATALNGIASQNLGNYRNFLTGMATMGQNAAVGAGTIGQQSANSISGLYGQIGENNANGTIGQANAWNNALSGVGNAAGMYFGQQGQQPVATGVTDYGAFMPNTGQTANTGGNANWLSGAGSGLNYASTGGGW